MSIRAGPLFSIGETPMVCIREIPYACRVSTLDIPLTSYAAAKAHLEVIDSADYPENSVLSTEISMYR
jgi:hypothetical protein